MIKAVVFGGTTEGKKLCEVCTRHAIPIRYCVATADGARQIEKVPNVHVRVGKLGIDEMAALLDEDNPLIVIDATHPYAEDASRNIATACRRVNATLLRVTRDISPEQDCNYFSSMENLLLWLEQQQGNIFVATGSTHAEIFTKLPSFQSRVWLRILPSMDSLSACLNLGYHQKRLICMQGPFSQDLNRAMFQSADAKILVTKNSGGVGGFAEKIRAAASLGMISAVLTKAEESGGISLDEACKKLMELIA